MQAEIGIGGDRRRMVGAPNLALGFEGPRVSLLGLGLIAGGFVVPRQFAGGLGDGRMPGRQGPLLNLDRSRDRLAGPIELVIVAVETPFVEQRLRVLLALFAETLSALLDLRLVNLLGFLRAAGD